MNTQEKEVLLEKLYAPYKKCMMCPLARLGRTNVVFGTGPVDASLLFIGEGPGADEDAQGKPFVGKSGKLLTTLIELAGLSRSAVFITNVVKCRPPGNRKPTPQESSTCMDLLLYAQIEIIQPRIICTLGSAALQGLMNDYTLKITALRGSQIYSPLIKSAIPILPTYHPAYALRNPKELNTLYSDIEKAVEISRELK